MVLVASIGLDLLSDNLCDQVCRFIGNVKLLFYGVSFFYSVVVSVRATNYYVFWICLDAETLMIVE